MISTQPLLCIIALCVLQACAVTTVTIGSTASHAVPTTLFGVMYEVCVECHYPPTQSSIVAHRKIMWRAGY
ncbi:hypothetical protein BDY19DRAFT_149681 [Irpex rosettiformis]|uniref:Uncharacterized protein n=1 Tax=Irpex rosettiformis TaxID=378272 RepID=A0ACB8U3G8_9APHY|nr:hypothetical protein BDY19DRAFT_149681 [Irpex rosettiformis]